jgi:hypothetical protein
VHTHTVRAIDNDGTRKSVLDVEDMTDDHA